VSSERPQRRPASAGELSRPTTYPRFATAQHCARRRSRGRARELRRAAAAQPQLPTANRIRTSLGAERAKPATTEGALQGESTGGGMTETEHGGPPGPAL
jgi:hypothetical protein